MIIPLLLCGLIWIFLTFVGLYLGQAQLRLARQRSWLRDQHHTLEHHFATYALSQTVYNIDIPGIDQWIDEGKRIMGAIGLFQLLNAFLAFQILIQSPLTYEPYAMAIGVAGIGYAFTVVRTRRYEADRVCYDVKEKVEGIPESED